HCCYTPVLYVFPYYPYLRVLPSFPTRRSSDLLRDAYRGTAFLLGDVVEADDAYTGSHSLDVVELTLAVAEQLGLSSRERRDAERSEEHTSELQSPCNLVCRLLLEKKK